MRKAIIGLLLLTGAALGTDIGFNGDYWAMTYFKGKVEFSEWKKLGVNSVMVMQEEDAKPAFAAGFPFYNEYVLPQIGYDGKVASMFDFIQRKYFADGEVKRLIRKQSFSDPEYWADSKKRLTELINKKKNLNPLAWCWGDECSVTSYTKAFDYDFGPVTLTAMRDWLKGQYGTIDNLNKEWETNFGSFEAVKPFTTDEAKERYAKSQYSFAPWADHRTFMELSMADFLDKCRKYAEALDPKTPAGIAGCQMPCAFGGYDWWQLSKVLTFVEAYDIGQNIEMIRSFTDKKKVFTCSTTFQPVPETKRKIWERLFQGERGTIIYDESVNKGENKTVEFLKDTFLELNSGIAKKIINAERVSDPVAIHYSQASIHAAWMLESGTGKRDWVTFNERQSSRFARNREGWCKLIEDLGVQYKFVSYEQIENGELIKGGYKVFIMPESIAVSPKEVKAIEEFVNAGGVLIGDNQTAIMDEHCKRQKEGQLDKVFGIKRSGFNAEETPGFIMLKGKKLDIKAAEGISIADTSAKGQGTAAGTPVIITRDAGKGKAVYLNCYLESYPKLRLAAPKDKPVRDIVGDILAAAGIKCRVTLTSASGSELSGYEVVWFKGPGPKEEYLTVLRNAAVIQDELGGAKEIGKAAGKMNVKIGLQGKGKITDLRTSKDLGVADSISASIDPYEPVIYSIIWQ